MTQADADSLARSHGMQPDEAGRHIWYDGLGPRPHEIFGQSALRVDCGPDARSEFGSMTFIKRQQYRSCLAFGPVGGDRSRVGSISSVQTLDPNATQASTLAALVGKYGPPSQQTASNELLWFAKDPSGETVAIDALFTDPYAEANQDRTAENSGTTGGPKLLDVEAEFFHLPAPPASAAPSAPQL